MYTQVIIAAFLAGLVNSAAIETRQTGSTSNEFTRGGCKPVLFAFARGSTEPGNMGIIAGPPTSNALKRTLGANMVATEGITYDAALAPNALPGGTDAKSKQAMQDVLNAMAAKCPDSVIVAGGYSQGAAVSHRAIESLSQPVKDQIAGVILYGDTQKQQDNNQIPNFPPDKTKIICQPGDAVCFGTLTIFPAHLTYGARAEEGAAFLAQKAQAAMAAKKAKRAVEEAKEAIENVKRVEKMIMA